MMNTPIDQVWEACEKASRLPGNITRSSDAARCRRFYRGDQWSEYCGAPLPHPVFNILRRIVDSRVGALTQDRYDLRDADYAHIYDLGDCADMIAARLPETVSDAILTGIGVMYVEKTPDGAAVHSVDPMSVIVPEPDIADIDAQPCLYFIRRFTADQVRYMAKIGGSSAEIAPDDGTSDLVTTVTRLVRGDDGVTFDVHVRSGMILRGETGMRHYPLAVMRWPCGRCGFYGASMAASLIPNQKYVNLAWAMAMKHMTDTAFSKIIYDRTLIPEWTNETGQAIGVMGGGDVSRAAVAVGVGQMQDGYLDLIDRASGATKELSGATEAALGETAADNVSAILALQKAADVSLAGARREIVSMAARVGGLYLEAKGIRADVTAERYASDASAGAAELRRLYENGDIGADTYVEFLPQGVIDRAEELVKAIIERRKSDERE